MSPDGRLRLDATSPDNAGERERPFAKDFTYTLTDTGTGQAVWSVFLPEWQGSPIQAFVNDEGWAVAWASGHRIIVLEPTAGERVLDEPILHQFEQDDKERYVHDTTGGPMWSIYSHWTFVEHRDATHFVVRPFWADRIVIDLAAGKIVDPEEDLAHAIRDHERDWARRTVRAAAKRRAFTDEPLTHEHQTALVIAAQLRDTTLLAEFRAFERSDQIDTRAMLPRPSLDLPLSADTYEVRSLVHTGLRRMGEHPREPLGAVRFGADPEGANTLYLPPERSPQRIDEVTPGLSTREVLGLIGLPDATDWRRRAWIFDIDTADPPYSLVVGFEPGGGRVRSVERVPPEYEHLADWIERTR